jgi:hypothetical protein
VTFDDDRAVAGAGLALVAALSEQLGTYTLANELIDLGGLPGHAVPGRKVLTLVHAMVAGADCIDDCDVLRSGATGKVLGHGVMAPSTLGTFLRIFSFGHVRQLDALSEALLARAWSFGAGPGGLPMTIDIDSTICEVYGKKKQGSAYGYTGVLGQHPLVATRADTGARIRVRGEPGGRGRKGLRRVQHHRAVVADQAGSREFLDPLGPPGDDVCPLHELLVPSRKVAGECLLGFVEMVITANRGKACSRASPHGCELPEFVVQS